MLVLPPTPLRTQINFFTKSSVHHSLQICPSSYNKSIKAHSKLMQHGNLCNWARAWSAYNTSSRCSVNTYSTMCGQIKGPQTSVTSIQSTGRKLLLYKGKYSTARKYSTVVILSQLQSCRLHPYRLKYNYLPNCQFSIHHATTEAVTIGQLKHPICSRSKEVIALARVL